MTRHWIATSHRHDQRRLGILRARRTFYLGLVAAVHDEEAGTGAKIDFTQLAMFAGGEERRP
jgi:hypothetical protein